MKKQIIYLPINDIKPYERNARNNKDSIDYVANSIKEFGFQQPIILDKDNVIVCGHTRYYASKKLKIKEVPCIIADDLSEEQVKAYRLADNKVAEFATWDVDLLNEELQLIDIDMSNFGFELFEEKEIETSEEEPKENERMKTAYTYKLFDFDASRSEGKYQIPILKPCNVIPHNLMGFNYVLSDKGESFKNGIHFFLDDYQFERIWNDTEKYIDLLSEYQCVLTPDFSLYREMSVSQMIYNVYRSRLIGQILQDNNINVIPTVSWCEENTFEFAFLGLPHNATLCISTIGVKREDKAYDIWKNGMDEMIKKCTPKTILVYGGKVEYEYPSDIKVIYFKNSVTERMKGGRI